LIALGINPDIIVEPTCGIGNFIELISFISINKKNYWSLGEPALYRRDDN
jgi:hypothetical protein